MYGDTYIHNFTNYGLHKFLFVTLSLTHKKNICLLFFLFSASYCLVSNVDSVAM